MTLPSVRCCAVHRHLFSRFAPFSRLAVVAALCFGLGPASAAAAPAITDIDGVCDVRDGGSVTCGPTFPDGARGTGVPHGTLTEAQLERRTVVRDLTDAVGVSGNGDARCALRTGGVVSCWGTNLYLGVLSYAGRGELTTPVAVPGVAGATDLAVGGHACVVGAAGAVRCWGEDGNGQASGVPPAPGDSGARTVITPTTISGIPAARDVAVGHSLSCIAAVDGTVWCWGLNGYGGFGTGAAHGIESASTPIQVPGVSGATVIAIGGSKVCVVRDSGGVWCWGQFAWRAPQLTSEEIVARDYAKPTAVAGATDAVQVSVGRSVACARQRSGHVRCWGDNSLGQLGALARRSTASLEVRGLDNASDLSLTADDGCALRTNGRLACWGPVASVQALDPADRVSSTTVPVKARISDVSELGVAANHWCAVLTSREARCVGIDMAGPREELLGFDGSGAAPAPSADLAVVDEFVTGESHSCFRLPSSEVRCFGVGNAFADPVQTWNTGGAGALTGVVDLAGGRRHVCALRSDQTVWCWGSNAAGQASLPIGSTDVDGAAAKRSTTGVLELLAVGDRTCARKAAGVVVCWGAGSGPGGVDSVADTLVDLPSPATGLHASGGRTCASHTSGPDTCWGPVAPSFATPVTCSLTGGDVWCSGEGTAGLLGVGSERFTRSRSVAVDQITDAIVVPPLPVVDRATPDETAATPDTNTKPSTQLPTAPGQGAGVVPKQGPRLRSAKASRSGRTITVRLVLDPGASRCAGSARATVRLKKRAFKGNASLATSGGACRATVKVRLPRGLRGTPAVRWSASGLSGSLSVRR